MNTTPGVPLSTFVPTRYYTVLSQWVNETPEETRRLPEISTCYAVEGLLNDVRTTIHFAVDDQMVPLWRWLQNHNCRLKNDLPERRVDEFESISYVQELRTYQIVFNAVKPNLYNFVFGHEGGSFGHNPSLETLRQRYSENGAAELISGLQFLVNPEKLQRAIEDLKKQSCAIQLVSIKEDYSNHVLEWKDGHGRSYELKFPGSIKSFRELTEIGLGFKEMPTNTDVVEELLCTHRNLDKGTLSFKHPLTVNNFILGIVGDVPATFHESALAMELKGKKILNTGIFNRYVDDIRNGSAS